MSEAPPGSVPSGPTSDLEALLAPGSVAVIGASTDPIRIGGRPVHYMLRAGFGGPIWPVNPNRDEVQGLRSYPSVADVPEAPDACIIAVPAPLVPETLEACVERGARAAVILSSGFAETGEEEGERFQRRVAEIARERGIRVLGPNTLGLFNAHTGWMGTFASTVRLGTPEPGPIGVAAQSGAVGSELFALLRRRGLNTGIWITTGNEVDVGLADAVAYLADHAKTEIIAVYAEGVRDGPALRGALRRASEVGKPVLFLKSGRSDAGAAAVRSHTAALAGSDRIYGALFEQYGALRVATSEELVDAAYAAARASLPAGRRLLVLTISGGAGVQMADAAADLGLELPPPSEEARARLLEMLPIAAVRNPVDTTAQVFNDIRLIGRYLRVVLDEGRHDALALFLTSVAASEDVAPGVVAELAAARERFPDVPIVVSLAAPDDLVRPYTEAGFPVFAEPTRAVKAVSFLCRLFEFRARSIVEPAVEIPDGAERVGSAGGAGSLSEHRAMEILEGWGVPCVRRRLVDSGEEAVAAAEALGGRVALKIASPDLLHKSDVDGVLLDVEGSEAVRRGYRVLMERAERWAPEARIEGVLVARMVGGNGGGEGDDENAAAGADAGLDADREADAGSGADAVVGVVIDPTFGPAVMVGLGGVLVEVLDDVAFRLAPFDEDEARRMIAELEGAKLFDAFRGRPALDVDALAALLSRVSHFAAAEAHDLSSVDLNPVRVLPRARGVVVLDAAVVLEGE